MKKNNQKITSYPISKKTESKEGQYKINKKISLSAKTDNQRELFKSIKNNLITIATGSAGSGKTIISVVSALESFFKCQYGKIIFTRPCIEADGENLGFLPGDLNEKISPYMIPIFDFLSDYMERSDIERMILDGKIITLPLAFMRGTTFKNSFVLLDEAQNTTPKQMKMFLTRIGENCKIVMTGDPKQTDIRGANGLTDIVTRLEGVPDIGIVRFSDEDVVRHEIIKIIEKKYEGV
jgi:phosphate starvation-inducible PhoH-like protein